MDADEELDVAPLFLAPHVHSSVGLADGQPATCATKLAAAEKPAASVEADDGVVRPVLVVEVDAALAAVFGDALDASVLVAVVSVEVIVVADRGGRRGGGG